MPQKGLKQVTDIQRSAILHPYCTFMGNWTEKIRDVHMCIALDVNNLFQSFLWLFHSHPYMGLLSFVETEHVACQPPLAPMIDEITTIVHCAIYIDRCLCCGFAHDKTGVPRTSLAEGYVNHYDSSKFMQDKPVILSISTPWALLMVQFVLASYFSTYYQH